MNKVDIIKLYKEIHSQSEVARRVGLSRQRIHQIVKGYTKFGRQGRQKLYDLVWKDICQNCFKEPSIGLHHKDLDNRNDTPENLIAVCIKCHTKCHLLNGWSKNNGDKCRNCHRTSIRHDGHGLCNTCWRRERGYDNTEHYKQIRHQRHIRLMLEDDSYWEYAKEIQTQRFVRKAIGEYIDKRKKQ